MLAPLPEVYLVLPAPVPASRAKSNGAHRYHDPKEPYALWRAAAEPLVRRAWPKVPIVGPVAVDCAYILPRPKNCPA